MDEVRALGLRFWALGVWSIGAFVDWEMGRYVIGILFGSG